VTGHPSTEAPWAAQGAHAAPWAVCGAPGATATGAWVLRRARTGTPRGRAGSGARAGPAGSTGGSDSCTSGRWWRPTWTPTARRSARPPATHPAGSPGRAGTPRAPCGARRCGSRSCAGRQRSRGRAGCVARPRRGRPRQCRRRRRTPRRRAHPCEPAALPRAAGRAATRARAPSRPRTARGRTAGWRGRATGSRSPLRCASRWRHPPGRRAAGGRRSLAPLRRRLAPSSTGRETGCVLRRARAHGVGLPLHLVRILVRAVHDGAGPPRTTVQHVQ